MRGKWTAALLQKRNRGKKGQKKAKGGKENIWEIINKRETTEKCGLRLFRASFFSWIQLSPQRRSPTKPFLEFRENVFQKNFRKCEIKKLTKSEEDALRAPSVSLKKKKMNSAFQFNSEQDNEGKDHKIKWNKRKFSTKWRLIFNKINRKRRKDSKE